MANPNDHRIDTPAEKARHDRMQSPNSFVRDQATQADNWARTSRKFNSAMSGNGFQDPKAASPAPKPAPKPADPNAGKKPA